MIWLILLIILGCIVFFGTLLSIMHDSDLGICIVTCLSIIGLGLNVFCYLYAGIKGIDLCIGSTGTIYVLTLTYVVVELILDLINRRNIQAEINSKKKGVVR